MKGVKSQRYNHVFIEVCSSEKPFQLINSQWVYKDLKICFILLFFLSLIFRSTQIIYIIIRDVWWQVCRLYMWYYKGERVGVWGRCKKLLCWQSVVLGKAHAGVNSSGLIDLLLPLLIQDIDLPILLCQKTISLEEIIICSHQFHNG